MSLSGGVLDFSYSILKTRIGSSRDARHAGTKQASAAEAISNAATAAKTPGSSGWVSYSMDLMNCVVAALATNPSKSPMSAGRSPSASIPLSTCSRGPPALCGSRSHSSAEPQCRTTHRKGPQPQATVRAQPRIRHSAKQEHTDPHPQLIEQPHCISLTISP
jgi:hypothetical protein